MLVVVSLNHGELVSSIEFSSDKLIIGDCFFKLRVEDTVLLVQEVTVSIQSLEFFLQIGVAFIRCNKGMSELVNVVSHYADLSVSGSAVSFGLPDFSGKVPAFADQSVVFLLHSVVSVNFIIESASQPVLVTLGLIDVVVQSVNFSLS